MKKCVLFSFFILNYGIFVYPQNDFFPLEIGNRWDYNVDVHINGGIFYADTFSVSIKDTLTIKGKKYFQFSSSLPFLYPTNEYFRTENNKVYIFNEQDSLDCFIFRFDLPPNTLYINCKGSDFFFSFSDTISLWGSTDVQQHQGLIVFSENYGIYKGFGGGIVERDYMLNGCIISGVKYGNLLVSVNKVKKNPSLFKLEQNYPNPFNPSTTINFYISKSSFVILKVYDMLGREITTLVNEKKQIGNYEVNFNAKNLSSGIYFYRIQAGNFTDTKKLILLR